MSERKELPEPLEGGTRSRLFPVLADTSREGRSLSILLACLENVDEFGQALLSAIGQRVGKRSVVETYTEVVLQQNEDGRTLRPDGLLIVRKGAETWTALVEAKVGGNELSNDQLEAYLRLARQNRIDALITVSNQFASLPAHHPVSVASSFTRRVDLYHWSWTYVLTEAKLLIDNDEVENGTQKVLLNEFVRFLSHPSAGVRQFEQMPAIWPEVVSKVQAGANLRPGAHEVGEVIGAWHQEVRDLSLVLSRQLATTVSIRTKRAHATDAEQRLRDDSQILSDENCLDACLVIPDAASPIDISADLQRRTISVSLRVKAPEDRKGTKARVNWLARQIPHADLASVFVRTYWPGRAAATQHPLAKVAVNPEVIGDERPGMVATSFEVILVRDLGAKFGSRKKFIAELEAAVPEFYDNVGQHIRAWQARPPRMKDESVKPASVETEAIRLSADAAALWRDVWNDEKPGDGD